MTNYQSATVTGPRAAVWRQIRAVQSEHQAIIRDVLEAADFWGGTRSRVWQQFVADLGRNFQVIYDQRNNVNMQSAVPAAESQVSIVRKQSTRQSPSLHEWRPASC